MKERLKYEMLAIISIVIAVAGQLAMKWGMSNFSNTPIDNFYTILSILINPLVIAGFLCYIAAMFLWLFALKGLPLSYAYPLQSLSIVLIFLFSWLLLRENITTARWIGFGIILAGIGFLTSKKK